VEWCSCTANLNLIRLPSESAIKSSLAHTTTFDPVVLNRSISTFPLLLLLRAHGPGDRERVEIHFAIMGKSVSLISPCGKADRYVACYLGMWLTTMIAPKKDKSQKMSLGTFLQDDSMLRRRYPYARSEGANETWQAWAHGLMRWRTCLCHVSILHPYNVWSSLTYCNSYRCAEELWLRSATRL